MTVVCKHALLRAALCVSLLPLSVQAQSLDTTPLLQQASSSFSQDLVPVISGPDDSAVGRTIVLDATLTRLDGENAQYRWTIEGEDDRVISETVEAVYTPEKPGDVVFHLEVVLPLADGGELRTDITHTVTVYSRKIVLIADPSISAEKLQVHRQSAQEAGVYVRILQPQVAAAPLVVEEQLSQLLSERGSAIVGADALVFWTDGISGLQALMRGLQGDSELLASVHNMNIVQITERNLQTLARVARGPFSELQPLQILLTRPEAINPLFFSENITSFIEQMNQRDIEYLRIDESTAGIRPWNLLSSLVNAMLTKGVPSQTVLLLLILPVIATILTFLKQVIGITTFGLYTPSIIALSFLALGWQLGVLFLLFIVLTGYLTRSLMRGWRLLYIPKVAVILTVVSLTLLVLMGISARFGVTFSRETIFILLIMSTLAESFLAAKTEQGTWSAVLGIGETILASLICVFIVQWSMFQSIILAYPELTLLTIPANMALGRFSGLRLLEYFRFKEVFKHMQEE